MPLIENASLVPRKTKQRNDRLLSLSTFVILFLSIDAK